MGDAAGSSEGPEAVTTEYRSEDRAILLRFYQSLFWERLLRVLPRSLHPNTITLVAEASALLAAGATWGAVHGARYLYLVAGALLFVYMTGDNIDGQHARRTKQTSALGEFLDHGLDGAASCAILFCSAFGLRIDGPYLAGLVALGSLGFGGVFWAQYRTGTLVTPRISAMEGVTGASLFQVALFALGEPSRLLFNPKTLNAASALLVVLAACYLYAILSPVLRAAREGARLAELGAPLGVAIASVAFACIGSDGIAPSIIVALSVADTVCRMIRMRRRGEKGSIATPLMALPIVPLVPAALHLVDPSQCAWVGASLATAIYLRSFLGGIREMARG